MTAATKTEQVHELAYRSCEGIEVSLLWNSASNALTVTVHDSKAGERFELAAHPARALDVFNHPFAYAASRGLTVEAEPALAA